MFRRVVVLLVLNIGVTGVFGAGTTAPATAPVSDSKDSKMATNPGLHSNQIVLRRCVVEYTQSTLLMSPLASFLQERSVKLGDVVTAGQVLGRLHNKDIQAQVELYASEANTDLYVRIAKADRDLAVWRLERSDQLNRNKAMSQDELRRDRYTAQRSALAIEEAEMRRWLAVLNQRRAEADLRVRDFISPHAGVVVDAYKNVGESVKLDDPVFRVVNPNRINVIGRLNIVDVSMVKVGQLITVLLDQSAVPDEYEHPRAQTSSGGTGTSVVAHGKVVFIDLQIEPETQTCRLVAEVDNPRHLLRGGMTVDATISVTP